MSAWANRRKGLYVAVIVLVLLAVGGAVAYTFFSTAPTCSDGKQNGTEDGIDCGGACQKICAFKESAATVEWARAVAVSPSSWTAIAYINNPNRDGAILSIPYMFKLYDQSNILVAQRQGTTYISPGQVNVIVEPGIKVGNRMPVRTFFEFSAPQSFFMSQDVAQSILIGERVLTGTSTAPKLTVTVSNTSLKPIQNVEATAVIFDTNSNAMAASKTIIPTLSASGSEELTFTWPRPFPDTPTKVDVRVRVKPL